MKSYTLFLDEILPNGPLQYFCLAGVIVENGKYETEIIPYINKIKNDLFGNTSTILHEADIFKVKKPEYNVMRDKDNLNEYISRIKKLFVEQDFKVVAVCVHEENLKNLYPNLRDKYFIGLQVILENYTNFLERHDAYGNIMIESRNHVQDEQLQEHFHALKATGTLFYRNTVLQSHLGTISFPLKADNIVGLQIADMIPNSLNRDLSCMKEKVPGLIDKIKSKTYDGFIGEADRFGIKVIPRMK